MSWSGWLLWGFAGTVVLTAAMALSQRLGLTRMNMPYLLGTCVTPQRDRAKLWGVLLHIGMGWLFALLYVLIFQHVGWSTWWLGALVGAAHATFLLTVLLPAMPGIHPRMAGTTHGPTVTRRLEPPGFAGLHYGRQTPLSIFVAHLVFGAIVGAGYAVP